MEQEPRYQTTEQFTELLSGRTLAFVPFVTSSKTGRPLSAGFVDVESGELLSVMTISGALEAGVVPVPDEAREAVKGLAKRRDSEDAR
jgi:hypothetical protein